MITPLCDLLHLAPKKVEDPEVVVRALVAEDSHDVVYPPFSLVCIASGPAISSLSGVSSP